MNGWFSLILFALSEGDPEPIRELGRIFPLSGERFGLRDIMRSLATLSTTGFAHQSRKGWWVIAHPTLGQISWRKGVDFRTCGDYLYLRRNGRLVLSIWPRAGWQYSGFEIGWEAAKAADLTDFEKEEVVQILNNL